MALSNKLFHIPPVDKIAQTPTHAEAIGVAERRVELARFQCFIHEHLSMAREQLARLEAMEKD